MNEPFPFDRVTTHTPEDAYLRVVEYVGASLRRDAVDKRIIDELKAGTATYTGSISTSPKPGIIDKVSDTEGIRYLNHYRLWPIPMETAYPISGKMLTGWIRITQAMPIHTASTTWDAIPIWNIFP